MTRAAYLRALRANRKALGICCDCAAGLDGSPHARCVECLDRQRSASRRFSRSPQGKALARVTYERKKARETEEQRRARFEAHRARMRERYMRFKLAGLCVSCGQAQAGDTNRCEPCRIELNSSALRWWNAQKARAA